VGLPAAPQASAIAEATDDSVPLLVMREMREISDKTGTLVEKKVEFKRESLKSDEVYIVDVGQKVFVWVGKGASKDERNKSMSMAVAYIKKSGRPPSTP